MKTIGLIGGMSWESTVPYYQVINRVIAERLGGLHSARILLHSVDFQEIEELQRLDRWDEAGRILGEVAAGLEGAGAEGLVLCTNTMHKVAPAIEARVQIPLLHIADATARAIQAAGFQRVGLLGTRFTMEQAFYRIRLEERYRLSVIIPATPDREIIHDVIYGELCHGRILEGSRAEYRRILGDLAVQGAQAVILGCTEISLLVRAEDCALPLFDTTAIHAEAAAIWALTEPGQKLPR
jgi:aspartate racemase